MEQWNLGSKRRSAQIHIYYSVALSTAQTVSRTHARAILSSIDSLSKFVKRHLLLIVLCNHYY